MSNIILQAKYVNSLDLEIEALSYAQKKGSFALKERGLQENKIN